MLVAFFESFKYIGHIFPVIVLRFYMGYFYFSAATEKFKGDYLLQPQLADAINEYLPGAQAPDWYRSFLESVVVPHWQMFAYTLMYFEFLVGISLLIGFFVRPVALLGAVLAWQYMHISSPDMVANYQLQMVTFFVLSWMGAGRCLGLDYFFFKRQRGILW